MLFHIYKFLDLFSLFVDYDQGFSGAFGEPAQTKDHRDKTGLINPAKFILYFQVILKSRDDLPRLQYMNSAYPCEIGHLVSFYVAHGGDLRILDHAIYREAV